MTDDIRKMMHPILIDDTLRRQVSAGWEAAEKQRKILDAIGVSDAVRQQQAWMKANEGLNAGAELAKLAAGMEPARAAMARLIETMKPTDDMRRFMESMRPSAEIAKMMESFRPNPAFEQMAVTLGSPSQAFAHLEGYRLRAAELGRWQDLSQSLAKSLSGTIEPLAAYAKSAQDIVARSDWQNRLAAGLKGLGDAHWMLADAPAHSALGYARVLRLSEATHSIHPFSESVTELLKEELGDPVNAEGGPLERDAQAVEAGMSADVIAFPPAAYPEIIRAVGFNFVIPMPPIPIAVENPDPTAVFDPANSLILTALEQILRQHIETVLKGIHGEEWIKRTVNGNLRKKWQDRQAIDRERGSTVFDPIQYSDFVELGEIIIQSNHWPHFKALFVRKESLMESMLRLSPIRNADRHSRPLGRADVLFLVSEATRIFGLLGRSILH